MKLVGVIFFILMSGSSLFAQNLYLRTFGDQTNNAVIFLHGGPGYNSASFEATTAQVLADQGLYVVVYDRRGEGRSAGVPADFTYDEAIRDLNFIYDSLNLKAASLIGHSFGGIIGTKFAKAEKEKVLRLVLVGAPVNLQESFKTILNSCRKIYTDKKEYQNLAYVDLIAESDSTTIAYSSSCFSLAMRNGFYSPKKPTRSAKKINKKFKENTVLYSAAGKMEQAGPLGFMRNEQYTRIDLSADLKELVNDKVKIYGIYGMEDGLYSDDQIEDLAAIIGWKQLVYLEKCSHNVFIDQQELFLNHLKNWCVN